MNIKRRKEIIKLLNKNYAEHIDYWHGESIEDVAHVKIIDSYITDGPGFCGTLVFVVFTGDPSFHQVFGISDNKKSSDYNRLVLIKQDKGFRI
jgi:hypothetical protein